MTEFVSGSFAVWLRRRVRWPIGLVLALGVGFPVLQPAIAQSYYPPPVIDDDWPIERSYRPQPLPGRQIVRMLRQDGFRPLSGPVLNRDVYYLDAVDPDGASVRVIVGAFDGEIAQVFVNRGRSAVLLDPDDGGAVDAPPSVRPRRPLRPVSPPVTRVPEVSPQLRPRAMPAPNPALTPANPTIAKRSPLAIPKDGGGPPVTVVPQGQKKAPRVIPLGPDVKAPATTPAPAPQAAVPVMPEPVPRIAPIPPLPALPDLPPEPAAPKIEMKSDLPAALPPGILDYRSGRTVPADKTVGEEKRPEGQ